MIVEIDIEKLRSHGLTPNDYVALLLKAENKTEWIHSVDLQYLQKQGYIKITDESFELRKPAYDLLKIRFKNVDEVETWIDDWRACFPPGKDNQGYPYKGDKQGCIRKMKSFMKKYPYTKEQIFKATRDFVETKRRVGFAYMTLAHYFIEKDGISFLAGLCENSDVEVAERGEFNEDI